MTDNYPSLTHRKAKEWTEWVNRIETTDFLNMYTSQEPEGNVTLLPRPDITLYGWYPNMEPRLLVICKDCSKCIQYCGIKAHWVYCRNNKKHNEQPIETPNFGTAVKEKCPLAKNKKKSVLSKNVPPPPLFPKTAASPSSPDTTPVELPPPILQPVQMESASTNNIAPSVNHQSHNSRHKKSKKQVNVTTKEHDLEKQSGAIKSNREPHVKSSAISNHQVSGKKVSSGRSRHSDHSTSNHKVTKEARRVTFTLPVPIAPKEVVIEQVAANITSTAPQTKSVPTLCTTKLETICDVNLINPSTLVLQPVQHAVIPTSVNKPPTPEFAVLQPVQHAVIPASVNKPPAPEFAVLQPVQHAVIPTSVNKPPTPEFASQERKDLEVLMPMSPVTIISPIQLVAVPILHLPPSPTQPLLVSIPVQSNNPKMYSTHPKPLQIASVSTRKIGGAFLLQNQHLERQRSEINLTLNCESITTFNTIHNSNESVRRNTKRSNSEKLINNECKQARLPPDVNGFILHADVSEAAEAPHFNGTIHENNCFVK